MNYPSLVVFAMLACFSEANYSPDEITNLPGMHHKINFRQYSGYLNATTGKHLHYWFVESQQNPETDPLVLWMNGGPGCSSMEGMLKELGPFKVTPDGMGLVSNPFSWNKIANVLFLEAPAGVGFSYSDSGDYKTNDDITAKDNFLALRSFFVKYPQFKKNDLYITGESYGGVYVPMLSVLVQHNDPLGRNFKGFAVGNGFLDGPRLSNSIMFFAYQHGLMDLAQWNALTTACCTGVPTRETCMFSNSIDEECIKLVNDANRLIYDSGLNMYNLYADCTPDQSLLSHNMMNETKIGRDVVDKINLLRYSSPHMFLEKLKSKGSVPCTNATDLRKYLNQKEVRLALHIPPVAPEWDLCSSYVVETYVRQHNNMKPQVMQLIGDSSIKGLIYNGDVDMACNFLGDEWFVEDLQLNTSLTSYQPWKYDGQIAGFYKRYGNLAFLTVKGSGHMVPEDKPGPALHMISSFLLNKPY